MDDQKISSTKIGLFGWKSPLDQRINNIVSWWFPKFHAATTQCKAKVIDAAKPKGELVAAWESIYPHVALGYNRETHKHRDCGGLTHGLDCLLLTGEFEGGDLYLQDLNLVVEWRPGDFCAFDGKTFTHEVREWSGKERLCFIYFVKRNIFEHFGVGPLSPPKVADVHIPDPPSATVHLDKM